MGTEVKDDEEVFVKGSVLLDGYSIQDREQYVYDVLKAFSDSIAEAASEKGKIKQMKGWQRIINDLKANKSEKGQIVMTCALYAIKKRYRVMFINVIRAITGIEAQVETEG